MPTYVFRGLFTKSKVGVAPANAPTVDVCDSAGTLVVTGGSPTTLSGIVGLYGYSYTNATAGEYIAVFKTADTTVDLQHIPSWTPTVIYTNLDATVSSRNATTPPTVDAIADQVWDELIAGHAVATSTGALLTTAGAAADPLLNAVPGTYASGSAGAALGRIASGQLTIVQPVIEDGLIRIRQGDDYYAADGRSFDITYATWPVLTGATITWTVAGVTITGSVVSANTVRMELTKVQSASLPRGAGSYSVKAVLVTTTHAVTLVEDAIVLVS
jgi:hypothetical protein